MALVRSVRLARMGLLLEDARSVMVTFVRTNKQSCRRFARRKFPQSKLHDKGEIPTLIPARVWQLSRAWGNQVVRWAGFLWTSSAQMPGRTSGILLKSNRPSNQAHNESLGLSLELRSRFEVMTAWGTRQSQRWRGKHLPTLHRPAMK